MVITQTPFRVSFFGGGTDYPTWFREHGGTVVSTTIDKYCFISCRNLPPFFEHKHRIVYSLIENVSELSEIKHPAVRAVLEYMNVEDGVEIHHDGDLPARSGIGSSSSFTVGLLHSIYALRGELCSKYELARQAIYLEQEVMKENVGSQDQIAVTFGGLNRIDLHTDNTFAVYPLVLPQERIQEFQDSLMLFYTGQSRISSEIAKSQIENMDNKKVELRMMHEIAQESAAVLQSSTSRISEIGTLLHQTWELKRSLSRDISGPTTDAIYETGRSAGAIGGKLIGAGGGGFFLFLVPPERRASVKAALSKLLEVPFKFEKEGTKIAYFNPR